MSFLFLARNLSVKSVKVKKASIMHFYEDWIV